MDRALLLASIDHGLEITALHAVMQTFTVVAAGLLAAVDVTGVPNEANLASVIL